MLGNRVKEITSSTGAGDITLSGAASNHITFNTRFGTNRRFYYLLVDDVNNDWEVGIGYLSTATNLKRETVLNSSNADAAVNFTAIDFAINSVSQDSLFSAQGLPSGASRISAGSSVITSAYGSFAANKLYATPVYLDCAVYGITEVGTQNSIAGAGGTLYRAGIYSDKNGEPDKLLAETSTTFAADTTADVSGTFTAIDLVPGRYWLALVSDGAPDPYRCSNGSANWQRINGGRTELGHISITHTFGVLPSNFGSTGRSVQSQHVYMFME